MDEVDNNTYEALINHLFDEDFSQTDFQIASSSIFLPEEFMQAQCLQDENGTNQKSDAKNQKSGKIAAYLQQERRPWLKQESSTDQTNPGNEVAKEKPTLQSPAMKKEKIKKQDSSRDTTLYQKVIEEVANKTHEAFLKHFGDGSVHVQLQQLWKLKLKNKKVKIGSFTGKLPPADFGQSGRFSNEKDPQLVPLPITRSIPLQGQSTQFQCIPTYEDGNERISKSAAYKLRKLGFCKKQESSTPWPGNASCADFEEPTPKKFKLPNPAKKQEVRQPWLKQEPFANKNNAGSVELRQTFQCFLHQKYFKENLKNPAYITVPSIRFGTVNYKKYLG